MTGSYSPPLDRSRPPRPGSVRAFDFPSVTSSTLSNGVDLKVARMARVPVATLTVLVRAGETHLPDVSAGLAVLSGEALESGTSFRTGLELAEAFENIGAGLSVRTGWDATTASLTCLAERLPDAGSLLAETLLSPSFPPEEIERLRNQRLAAIRQRRMDPGSLADDAAVHFFYSDASPYHRPLTGSEDSVGGVGPTEISGFFQDRYRPSGASAVVVGDVEEAEVESLIRKHFGDWSGPPAAGSEAEAAPRFSRRRIMVVDRPGSVQSEVRIGHVGVPRSTPRYFPLKIFNTILGGAFTSRLMLRLREDLGFTYGVRSRLAMRRGAGPFTMSMAVATDVTAQAVEETFTQVDELLEGGPTPDEVERARDYIAGVFPLQLETTGQVASRIAETEVYDLPDDFYATYRDRIRAVTAGAALEAGRAVVRPSEMVVVVVGDASEIQGPLEDLDLGPVQVILDL